MKALLPRLLRAQALALASALALLATPQLRAGNTWDGGGGDDNWGTGANWNPDGTPGYGTITFSGTIRTSNVNNSITAMNQVNWTGTAAWTMTNSGGTVLSLFDNGGGQAKLEANTTGGVTINAPITFAANNAGPPNPFGEINALNSNISFIGGTLTVNGSSVNGIKFWGGTGRDVSFANTVSAAGKWFATTGSGSITVASGSTVTIGDAYVMNGGTLNLSGGSLSTNAVRLGGDFGTTGNQNQTLGGTLALTPTGGGLLFSGTVNSVAGNTSGNLLIDSKNTSSSNTLSGSIFLDSSLKVQQATGGSLALTGSTLDLKSNILTFQGGGDFNVAGVLSNSAGSGRVTQDGTGLLRFGAANTYTGETDINAGSIRVDVAPTGAGITSTYYVGNGGAPGTAAKLLVGGGAGGTSGGITFGNPVNTNAGSGGNRTIGGTNTTGTNTYSGTVTLADSNATFVAATGGAVAFNTVTAATLQTVSVGGGGNNGTVHFGGSSDNVNLSATVNSGTLQLAKVSSSSVHAVGGTLTVNSGGTAQLGGTGGDQIFNSASVVVNSGGAFDANNQGETVNNLTLDGTGISGAGALLNSGSGAATVTASGAITLAANTSVGASSSASLLTVSGKITGSADLRKVGSGRVSLIGSTSDYSGLTTVSAGILEVTTNNALGTTGSGTVVSSGGVLRFTSVNYSAAEPLTLNGNGSGSGAVTILGTNSFAGPITVATDATIGTGGGIHSLTVTGGIVKNGTTLTIAGGGTLNVNTVGISGSAANSDLVVNNSVLVLNTASTYNGPTTVTGAAGVIKLGASNVLPATPHTAISVMTGAKLDLNGYSDTVASLSGNGTVTSTAAGTPTLTLGGSDGSGDFSGVIQDGAASSVSLVKTGTGTQVLQGNNTYTGTTVVMNGTLQVGYGSAGESGTGNLTVNTTGTLAGTGTIMSNTILNGVLRPGDAAGADLGILSFGGDLTLGGSQTSYFQIGDPNAVYDQVRNSTGVSLLTVAGVIDLGSGFEGGYTPVDNDLWILFDSWGTIDLAGFNVGTNLLLPDVTSYGLAWNTGNLGVDGSISLYSTAPEPSRAMLILGTALLSLARRRRQNSEKARA